MTEPGSEPSAHSVVTMAADLAAALRRGDRFALSDLLHPEFTFTSSDTGRLDREAYVGLNCGGGTSWHDLQLADVVVAGPPDAAVLTATETDLVSRRGELSRTVKLTTQTWVREDGAWRCLAVHLSARPA